MDEAPDKYRQAVVVVASSASEIERTALLKWSHGLMEIRRSQGSSWVKAQKALLLTGRSEVIWPLVKMLARELRRVGWDERGTKARGFVVGGAVGLLLFGGQGAGIAALGTAVGLPLWVVLGAGGTVIAALIEELEKRRNAGSSDSITTTAYRVIDAEDKKGPNDA